MINVNRAGIVVICAMIGSLVGCYTAPYVEIEESRAKSSGNDSTLLGVEKYAQALSDSYLKLAANAAHAGEASSVALLASGATLAGAAVFDANTTLVRAAALAGGTTLAFDGYYRPGDARKSLIGASEGVICVKSAIQNAKINFPGSGIEVDGDSIQIALTGIATVKNNLRKELARERPDYSAIAANIRQSVAAQIKIAKENGTQFKSGADQLPEARASLKTAVTACTGS